MEIRIVVMLCLIILSVPVYGDDDKDGSPRAEFNSLVDQFEEAGGTSEFAGRFFELADRHRSDQVAIDAYSWILRHRRTKEDASRALDLVEKQHLADPNVVDLLELIAKVPSPKAETLLIKLIQSSPDESVRARACVQLAILLEQQLSTLQQLSKQPELKQRAAQYYGTHVVDRTPEAVTAKLEGNYERMRDSFGTAVVNGDHLGKAAERALFRLRNLSIGRGAPEIEGQDTLGKPLKLSDFRGQVVVLSFWAHW